MPNRIAPSRHAAPARPDHYAQQYEWIVLDVTGTLLRPEPSPSEVYREIASRFGHSIEAALMQQRIRQAFANHFGGDSSSHADDFSRPPTDESFERARWRRIVLDSITELAEEDFDAAFEHLWEHFRVARNWVWVDGARDLVAGLQAAGASLAIATNFDARVREILDGHPPLDQITTRFLSSEIGFSKPDPRFFRSIASRLACEPSRLLMIGDDPVNDLAGSRAAGWRAISIDEAVQ